LGYAAANGHARAAVFETTFQAETETDLFAEQAVLCGGLTELITAAFETLVAAGYPDELAYFCCLHEVKLIADLIHSRGIAGMRRSISSTAAFGDATRGPRVIGATSRAAMRELLAEIRDGRFAAELGAEMAAGAPAIENARRRAEAHPIETVGARLRRHMPWLEEG
jgi:ketol-acid reductoisomerase